MTLSIFIQNSMTFPEIPENFKIPENPWHFHDCGNPVLSSEGKYNINFRPAWYPSVSGKSPPLYRLVSRSPGISACQVVEVHLLQEMKIHVSILKKNAT